jgi:predicted MFS family arabinose efflux permease
LISDPQTEIRGPWSVVVLLAVAFVINYVDRQVVFSIFPLLRRDLHFSDAELGAIGTLFTWSYSLGMPFSGRLADILSRRKLVISSLALWSLATLATGLSPTKGLFLATRVAMGLCESLYVPAAVGLIAQAHPGPTRSRALSIHGFAQYAGITLGGWYGGWAGDHIGWRPGFFLLTAAGIAYTAVLLFAFRRLRFDVPGDPDLRSAAHQLAGENPKSTGLRNLLSSRCFVTLNALFFCFCGMLWMLYAWLPAFVFERYHLTLTQSGLTATIFLQTASAAGVLLGGWLGDSLARHHATGRFQVVIWAVVFCAPFAFAIFATHSLLVLKLSACGFGMFAGFFAGNLFSSLYDVAGPRDYGLATGLLNAVGGLGGGAAILVVGLWRHSLGIDRLMLYTLLASAAAAVLLWLVVRARFHRESDLAFYRARQPV